MQRLAMINPKRTAFLLCDIQERFRTLIHAYPSVITTASKMVEASNALSIPVLVTEQYPKAMGLTVPELDISKAAVRATKMKFSMCVDDVMSYLEKNDINSCVLFGIESHVCVLQTALGLLEKNYFVHVLADGVSSMNQGEIPIALQRMKQNGAFITTSDSILFQLTGDASHPNFKSISNIVKNYSETTKNNELFKSFPNCSL